MRDRVRAHVHIVAVAIIGAGNINAMIMAKRRPGRASKEPSRYLLEVFAVYAAKF